MWPDQSADAGSELDDLLDTLYSGQERMTSDEIHRRAAAVEASPDVMTLLDRLPAGEYTQDEVVEAVRQVDAESDEALLGRDAGDGWRDEERTPLPDLTEAMGTYSRDGQVDDPTGGEASEERAFGNRERRTGEPPGQDRPSPDGYTGPV